MHTYYGHFLSIRAQWSARLHRDNTRGAERAGDRGGNVSHKGVVVVMIGTPRCTSSPHEYLTPKAANLAL
ncbi:hypothetical protein VTO42DRAFT_6698 [Malbranchea cinnamomea]